MSNRQKNKQYFALSSLLSNEQFPSKHKQAKMASEEEGTCFGEDYEDDECFIEDEGYNECPVDLDTPNGCEMKTSSSLQMMLESIAQERCKDIKSQRLICEDGQF
jgi:hypothetical protein